jgi:hypothetical protein
MSESGLFASTVVADEVTTTILNHDDARILTDDVKRDALELWRRMLSLYEKGAHVALGYSSWGDYCEREFEMSKSAGYRVLDASRVTAQVESHSPMGEPLSERQARELAPLKSDPPRLVLAAETAQAAAAAEDRKPTARDYAEATEAIRAAPAEVIEKPKDLLGPYIAKRAREEKALGVGEFSWVSAAADSLRKLPPLERLWLPNDKGNVEALNDDIRLLAERVPKIAALWERHLSNLNRTEAA